MKRIIFSFLVVIALLTSCSEQERARSFGGDLTITLDPGQRLQNVTWKTEESLWILTYEDPTKPPAKYTYREKSKFGIVEGAVYIVEQ